MTVGLVDGSQPSFSLVRLNELSNQEPKFTAPDDVLLRLQGYETRDFQAHAIVLINLGLSVPVTKLLTCQLVQGKAKMLGAFAWAKPGPSLAPGIAALTSQLRSVRACANLVFEVAHCDAGPRCRAGKTG